MDSVKKTIFGSVNNNQASTLTNAQKEYLKQLSGQAGDNLSGLYGGYNDIAGSGSTFQQQTYNNPYQATGYNAQNTFQSTGYNPTSAYESVANWEQEFQNGVVNPAQRQMNQNISASRNRNNLHSRAAVADESNIRQNTADNISGQRYNNVMAQQQMKMQGQESALGREFSHLTNQAGLQQQGAESAEQRGLQHLTNQANLQFQGNSSLNDLQMKQQAMQQQAQEDAYTRRLNALQGLSGLSNQVLGTQGIQNYQTPTGGLLDIISAGGQAAGGIGALMKVI